MSISVILSIDQGTTGTRAIAYSHSGKSAASAYQEFTQHFPRPGWVEHNPEEIWKTTQSVIDRVLSAGDLKVEAIGITNQRETTMLWDRETGRPVHPAIVWQDRRTSGVCQKLIKSGFENMIRKKTGLMIDSYFSATKIAWMLNNVKGLRRKAEQGKILFGTMDSWLLWKLSGGKIHATDYTNASRTLLLDLKSHQWDDELLKIFHIPRNIMPDQLPSSSNFGVTVKANKLKSGIPIRSMIGDQQAALYGQGCYHRGQVKNTYGTGCFLMMNRGQDYAIPPHGLLTTLACGKRGEKHFALEGAVFIAGAAIQWLRDCLGFFKDAAETELIIKNLKSSEGVTVIPAFVGLGSPYWNSEVRGIISGITRGTSRAHIVRATLESIAHQSADVLTAMTEKGPFKIPQLKVDGGATRNHFLMQFQADMLRKPVLVSSIAESTAWGAAKLAGRAAGFWDWDKNFDAVHKYRKYIPRMPAAETKNMRNKWRFEIAKLLCSSPESSL